jgi:hypothetical protein
MTETAVDHHQVINHQLWSVLETYQIDPVHTFVEFVAEI